MGEARGFPGSWGMAALADGCGQAIIESIYKRQGPLSEKKDGGRFEWLPRKYEGGSLGVELGWRTDGFRIARESGSSDVRGIGGACA